MSRFDHESGRFWIITDGLTVQIFKVPILINFLKFLGDLGRFELFFKKKKSIFLKNRTEPIVLIQMKEDQTEILKNTIRTQNFFLTISIQIF